VLGVPSRASGWEILRSTLFVVLTRQEEYRVRWLEEVRRTVEAACTDQVRPVEVARSADLRLVAGEADWAVGVIRRLRDGGDATPIVAINATPGNGSNSRVLNAGADDCLVSHLDASELRARIQAVMRRVGHAWLRCPEIAADRSTLRIRVRNVEARVSRKQFDIFVCLAERRERWVHSDEIVATVCGTHHQPTSSLVRVQIHALRKALGSERDCIRCDGNRSYMLTRGPFEAYGAAVSSDSPSSLRAKSGSGGNGGRGESYRASD
jgi:two-component system, OmpR family, response regulator QseB